jgi:release factor glutamine methyltransferase
VAEASKVEIAGFAWRLDPATDVGRAMLAASRRLREAGVDSPQLDSALLMAHVLGVSKTWLYAHPDRKMAPNEIAAFESLVGRRLRREPVAYLIGFRSFYGLDITVDSRVLIPRPETEMLVERALTWIEALMRRGIQPKVADVGTGSGAIAVAIAVNAPGALIYATDLSQDALDVAAQNVWRYALGDQIQLIPGDLAQVLPEPVDIVVANLPYVPSGDLPGLAADVRNFEPRLALDGGADGLDKLRALFDSLASPAREDVLRPGARLYLEIGAGQGDAAESIARVALPDAEVEVQMDYAGLDRLLVIST